MASHKALHSWHLLHDCHGWYFFCLTLSFYFRMIQVSIFPQIVNNESSESYKKKSTPSFSGLHDMAAKNSFSPLVLSNIPSTCSDIIKFLGLRFHALHSWLPRIKETKVKNLRTLNVLKYPAHLVTGFNKKLLLPFYHMLLRFILYYGSPIYDLAPPSQLSPSPHLEFCSLH